jgi:hypothetical protein
MSNRAAFIETEKGQIVVQDAEIAQPEQGEVLIKVTLGMFELNYRPDPARYKHVRSNLQTPRWPS